MVYAALALAVVALFLAFQARSGIKAATDKADEALREAARRADGVSRLLQTDVRNLRRTVAALAAAEPLTREMVMEGQLWRQVDPKKAQEMVEKGGVRLIDVRTPQETAEGIIPGAQLIPLDNLKSRLNEIPKDGKPILMYCAGGARSATACEVLCEDGYANVMNLSGGIASWQGPRGAAK